MKAPSRLSARLEVLGPCLIAALTAACTFDASRLRHSHDGAPALPDLSAAESSGDTDVPAAVDGSETPAETGGVGGNDGPTGTGGADATDSPVSTGGVGGIGGSGGTGGSTVPDAAAEAPGTTADGSDTPVATGGVGGDDAPIDTGEAADGLISTDGTGGAGGSGGTGGSMVPDATVEDLGTADEVAADTPDAGCGASSQACCAGSTCTAGGCCVANNTCVANGAACSDGNVCISGFCFSSASLVASLSGSAFGSVPVGQSSNVAAFSITNGGQQTSGPISVTSNSTAFVVQSGNASDCVSGTTTLVAGASCTIRVVFAPKTAGPASAQIAFSPRRAAARLLPCPHRHLPHRPTGRQDRNLRCDGRGHVDAAGNVARLVFGSLVRGRHKGWP